MQQKTGRVLSTLALTVFAVAALSAPLAAYAGTEAVQTAATAPSKLPAAPQKAVRVGVGRSQTSVEVTAPKGFYVIGDGAIHWEVPAGQSVLLSLTGGEIQVAGLAKRFAGPVRLVPMAPGGIANPITYLRKPYRGEIEVLISPKDRKLSVVNVVNVEDYLMGVVPQEMYPSWPAEALKAQAIAARTYVLRNLGGYADEGFDVVDTPHSQAYGGIRAEVASTTAAVQATGGQVVIYNGQLANTMFHASSGGHTENNEIIFAGRPVPYLRGVPDYDDQPGNDRYQWRYSYTPTEFANKLSAANFQVGQVQQVQPAGTTGVSGRPSQWSVSGSGGSLTLTAQQLRSALGLPSSVRSVQLQSGGLANATRTFEEDEKVFVMGPYGIPNAISLKGISVIGAGNSIEEPESAVTAIGPVGQQAAGLTVEGGGYGHAVGLSQWGANGMALRGKTYQEILAHYYQGTQIETR